MPFYISTGREWGPSPYVTVNTYCLPFLLVRSSPRRNEWVGMGLRSNPGPCVYKVSTLPLCHILSSLLWFWWWVFLWTNDFSLFVPSIGCWRFNPGLMNTKHILYHSTITGYPHPPIFFSILSWNWITVAYIYGRILQFSIKCEIIQLANIYSNVNFLVRTTEIYPVAF